MLQGADVPVGAGDIGAVALAIIEPGFDGLAVGSAVAKCAVRIEHASQEAVGVVVDRQAGVCFEPTGVLRAEVCAFEAPGAVDDVDEPFRGGS